MIRQLTKKIDDDSLIASFFNTCLKGCNTAMIFSAPRTFTQHDGNYIYCSCLLFEDYASSFVAKLRQIINTISIYDTEFGFRWKYYASSKRINLIKEYGGDDEDYNKDGSVITLGIPDEKLASYSVVADLYEENVIDNVQDTMPRDLQRITTIMQMNASTTITDMFEQAIGKTVLPSKVDEDGNIKYMSRMDVEMGKAINKADADTQIQMLYLTCGAMQYILTCIKNLSKTKDNKEELLYIRDFTTKILNADIEEWLQDTEFIQFCKDIDKKENK